MAEWNNKYNEGSRRTIPLKTSRECNKANKHRYCDSISQIKPDYLTSSVNARAVEESESIVRGWPGRESRSPELETGERVLRALGDPLVRGRDHRHPVSPWTRHRPNADPQREDTHDWSSTPEYPLTQLFIEGPIRNRDLDAFLRSKINQI